VSEPLIEVRLGHNQLSGAIPTQLGGLSSLKHLELGPNGRLGVPLPLWTSAESKAVTATASSSNAATGEVGSGEGSALVWERHPTELVGIVGLPTQLGQLTELSVLTVHGLRLNSSIPTELGALTSLQYLYMGSSHVAGWLPTQLGVLPVLSSLLLEKNQLSGTIPAHLGNATALRRLSIEGNPLSGTIPDMFGKFRGLEYFSSYGCRMNKSHLPPSIQNVARRRMHFEFFVQDEQLELLADYRCERNNFRFQHTGRVNYVPALARNYQRFVDAYCTERADPVKAFEANFGPGDRWPNGFLKYGARRPLPATPEPPPLPPLSGCFRREDLWMLQGPTRVFRICGEDSLP